MKKRNLVYLLVTFFVLILLLVFLVFIGEKSEKTSSITGSAIIQTQCQYLSSPGTYVLDRDVSSSGTCFTVTAPNVAIDCDGHTITYSTGGAQYTRGVYSAQFNTTVMNCDILDGNPGSANSGRIGIYFNTGADNSTVKNNHIEAGYSGAIYSWNTDNGIIVNNNLSSRNGAGIFLTAGSEGYNITNNTARGQGSSWSASGIIIHNNCDDNILIDNKATSERYAGIWVTTSSERNILINNTGIGLIPNTTGIELSSGSYNNILINNTAIGNGAGWCGAGLMVYTNCSNNTIRDNTIISNGYRGGFIYRNGTDNLITNNIFITSGGDAALHLLMNCSNNIIKNNTFISLNGDDTLLIIGAGSHNCTAYHNIFTETTGYYIINSHSNNDTTYNTTVNGKPQGNYYFNISSLNITDSDGDGWGDGGSDYPLNRTTWPERFLYSAHDWGPSTNTTISWMPVVEETSSLHFFSKTHFFVTLFIIGLIYLIILTNKKKK